MAGKNDGWESIGPAEDDEWESVIEPESTGKLESGLRGLAQGASLGFADELTGALESTAGSLGLVPDKTYEQSRDESRANYLKAQTDNPVTYGAGQIGGGLATMAIPGLNVAKGASLARTAGTAALQGALSGLGSSESEDVLGMGKDALVSGVGGGILGGAAYGAGKLAEKALPAAGKMFSRNAEKLAEKATGATGAQAEKFAEGSGRELLDRGIVRFGRTPEDVFQQATKQSQEAGEQISRALRELDASGATASVDNVVASIEKKILELAEVPGNERLISQLRNEASNLVERGQSTLPLSIAERAKRAYQGQTNYNSPKFEQEASSHLASAFKNEVEEKALAQNPELGKLFKESKDTYGLLEPIKNASERRANQLNQSPFGGFGDLAAGGLGSVGGGPAAVAAVAARRFAAPRAASAMAVSFDKLGDLLQTAPERFGKYGRVLQNAAARGGTSLGAAHYVLQNSDPEYRKMLQDLQGE